MTSVASPQCAQRDCSGEQGIARSTRARFAGNACRPGCCRGRLCWSGAAAGRGLRSLSAATSRLLTPGSSSNSSSCVSLSFFAGWTVLLNTLQPQPFFQELNFQMGQLQLAFQLDYHVDR